MNLKILDGMYSICRLDPSCSIPNWISQSHFFSISRSEDELSVVCEDHLVPEGIKAERAWRLIKVEGPLDFCLTGVLSSLAKPLAECEISIFAISTFDTDYLLVKTEKLQSAKEILEGSGFVFI